MYIHIHMYMCNTIHIYRDINIHIPHINLYTQVHTHIHTTHTHMDMNTMHMHMDTHATHMYRHTPHIYMCTHAHTHTTTHACAWTYKYTHHAHTYIHTTCTWGTHTHYISHVQKHISYHTHIHTHTYVLYMHTKTHIHAHITHIHIIFYGLWFGCGVTYRPNLRAGLKFPFPRVSTLPSIYNSYSTWLRIMSLKHQPRSWKSAQNCPPVPQKT